MLSVIVNFYNNRREAMRTLHSMTRGYQCVADDTHFEVIAIDNGSSAPLTETEVRSFGPEFKYRYVQTQSPSPVEAINAACRDAIGDQVLVVIDGAHILSPGVFGSLKGAFSMFEKPFAATVGFHLGPKVQNVSVQEGYNQQVEDALLERIGWMDDGYRLFKAAGAFADDSGGWFGSLLESNAFAMRRDDFLAMGGLDERFQSRGGGLVNLDFFRRALCRQDLQYVMLLGEGSFHQVHGGVATNAPLNHHPWNDFHAEYREIRGAAFEPERRRPFFLGSLPDECLAIAQATATRAFGFWRTQVGK